MNDLKIVNDIAIALLTKKKAELNIRIDEIAAERNMSILEKARLRARAIEAMDRGELAL